MEANTDILKMVIDASFIVQFVMFILLITSLLSWTVIFIKWSVIKQAKASAAQFERRFWSGVELGDLYKKIASKRSNATGMETIFESGFKEYARLKSKSDIDPMAVLDGAQRGMRVAASKVIEKLENHLSFLATVGSTSPYIGLFGTVWGIMNSFISIGGQEQVTIAQVAPGIAEALIATAMGLFAAIPAVVSYNRYSNDVERLIGKYDTFMEEFASILQRKVHT